MKYARLSMKAESPGMSGPGRFLYNLAENLVRDRTPRGLGIEFGNMSLPYDDHYGSHELGALIAEQSGGDIAADDALITGSAAGDLFVISSSLLEPGYWFKLPDNCLRIGFGWTRPEDTRKGLQSVSQALMDCIEN